MEKLNTGILIFDNVEVLDFTGPYEVFSRTRLQPGVISRRTETSAPFCVFTVSLSSSTIRATGGLQVIPDYQVSAAPPIDLLVVPGGYGTRTLLDDSPTLEWICRTAANCRIAMSICTGALLYAKIGLLRNRRATTHWAALDLLSEIDSTITVEQDTRVVHDQIITSAGISAGIDMALSVVEHLHGKEVADETARYMEYRRVEDD
jgi:transcriptional regulator GlxA family with amidase domain